MKLNAKELKKLSKISNSLYDDLKVEFLFHSNHIEGSTFTKENLETLLYKKQVEGVHFYDDVIETRNSLDVFDKVINDSDQELDKFMLFDWHRTLKKGTVDDEIHNIGCWKQYENKIRGVDLKVAYPNEVDTYMYNLLMDWKECKHKTIEEIAKFHCRFEKIHPFQDGNGRIGRFIILKQCIESDVDLIAIDNKYEKEYKEALYKAQKTEDLSDLIIVFSKCQKRLAEKMKSYENTIELIKKEFETIPEKINKDSFDDYDATVEFEKMILYLTRTEQDSTKVDYYINDKETGWMIDCGTWINDCNFTTDWKEAVRSIMKDKDITDQILSVNEGDRFEEITGTLPVRKSGGQSM